MNAFVVSGLTKRRAELAGDLEGCHDSLRPTLLDLENLDPTILQSVAGFQDRNHQAQGISSSMLAELSSESASR